MRNCKKRPIYTSVYGMFACVMVCLCLLSACGSETVSSPESASGTNQTEEGILKKEIFAMDTIMDLTIYGFQEDGTVLSDETLGEVMNQAVALIQHLESLLSVTDEGSDTAKLNAAGGQPVTVSAETYELLEQCQAYSNETEGLFDISIYPLVREWGFTTEEYHVPSEEELTEVMKIIDYTKIRLLDENKVQMEADMEIDLGGAAKGYLSQKLMELFKEKGIQSAIVSLGGNVQTIGKKEDGSLYKVGITDPSDGVSLYGTLETQDKAVITSGIYQRYFEEDGATWHHIMDKRTGKPAENTLASVTVITDEGTAGDALATALYVMGEEGAIEFQKNHPEIEIILIRKDGSVWQSAGAGMNKVD